MHTPIVYDTLFGEISVRLLIKYLDTIIVMQ